MKIDCDMADENRLYVASWSTRNPQSAIACLQNQLEAAIVIWPELKGYKIKPPKERKPPLSEEQR